MIYQSPMCACVIIYVFYCCGSAGWKDLPYCLFTHRGSSSLTLKKLLSAVRVSCMGWDVFSYHATCHLLPPLGQEGITLALLVYLFQFFLPPDTAAPNRTTPLQMAVGTTESSGASPALQKSLAYLPDTACSVLFCK